MKTTVKWLREYINFETDLNELSDLFSLTGLEVEAIEALQEISDLIVVGKILSRDPHPNADRLSVCRVSDGSEEFQIVCGAPNCDAGNLVPMAKIGTAFSEDFVIKKAKLRGVESSGMLCSCSELGLVGDADGLMILDPQKFTLGTPLNQYYEADWMIDTEVTPNRPDWLSQIGIARELAALEDSTYTIPEVNLPQGSGDVNELVSVTISDPELCPRYMARVIKNVKIGPSPEWMQYYLTSIGLRPINNVVDITNYVLMECGQPLHAFDFDKLAGPKKNINIRCAETGERISLLNGNDRKLTESMLVITDDEKSIALAGVMGGGNSEIDDNTTTIVLESAAFNADNIRLTSRNLELNSDSSYRFERGVDLEMVEYASARAAQLICQYANGEMVEGAVDQYPTPYTPHQVTCRFKRINSLIGADISTENVTSIFNRLGLEVVTQDSETITVAIPSFRLDLDREVDLIEEISRIYGLNNLPNLKLTSISGGSEKDDQYRPIQARRETLLGLGFNECYTYSLLNEEDALNSTGFNAEEIIKLSNPLSAELSAMRPTLLPGMLQSVANNIAHQNHDLELFELGRVMSYNYYGEEHYEACLAITGQKYPERFSDELKVAYDFYDLKGRVEGFLASERLTNFDFVVDSHPFFKAGHTAKIVQKKRVIGWIGEVNPGLCKKIRLRNSLFMAIIDLKVLEDLKRDDNKFTKLPTTPATSRDISFVADSSFTHAEVLKAIRGSNVRYLEDVKLFDIFTNENLGENRKSMAYSFTYRDAEKTLNDKEVNKVHNKLIERLAKVLPIEIR